MDVNPFAGEIERLRIALRPPAKPSALVVSEKALAKLRRDRAILADQQREAVTRDLKGTTNQLSPHTLRLSGELRALDQKVIAARQAVAEQREAAGPDFLERVGGHIAAHEALVADLLTLLNEAVGVAVDLNHYALNNRLPANRTIRDSPYVHELIRQIRMITNGASR